MERPVFQEDDIVGKLVKERALSGAIRVLIPLFLTYLIFAFSVFMVFIPQQEEQLLNHKKETILYLTDSTLSLLKEYDARVREGKISLENARMEAISQIRNLRYGITGKDYFWINDMTPVMIMHPYRPDLEGENLTYLQDANGNYPFMAMVETVLKNGGGYVNYFWQWRDLPEKVVPKLSYVKGFAPWGWIVGTGLYEDDIQMEIDAISKNLMEIFGAVFLFILLLSIYITIQVFRMEQHKNTAEKARALEELRLKKLLELSRMTGKSEEDVTLFALKETVSITNSELGYLALLNEDNAKAMVTTWSPKMMNQKHAGPKGLVTDIESSGLWTELVRSKDALVINDFKTVRPELKRGLPDNHPHFSRILNVPVFDGEKLVALAGVANKQSDYTESDIRQAKLMADGLWKILQKRQAEDDLRQSENRYRLLADNATDLIWVFDLPALKCTYVSPSVKHLLGYEPNEIISINNPVHLTEDSMGKMTRMIEMEMERDLVFGDDPDRIRTLELEMIRKDGAYLWGEVAARFLKDKAGPPSAVLGIIRNMTDRKSLEKQLIAANTDLRMAQQIAGIGNWSIDPDADRPVWSEEVYKIYERDPEQGPLPLSEYRKIYSPKMWAVLDEAITKATRQGIPYDIELKIALPSGKVKWVHSICEPEKTHKPDRYFLRGTIQDISDRKKMETHIQQSRKMEALGTLAGGIAHDFNNILSAMIGFTELAKLGAAGDQDIEENLNQVLTSGLRARELVRHILTFSRKADVRKKIIPVLPLLKESIKFLKASAEANIKIKTDFNKVDPGISLLADATQLYQVFMNIFTNAAHAMKENGGTLGIFLKPVEILEGDHYQPKELPPGRYVKLVISDSGEGIPKHLIDKIFEPFFTTKSKGEGTGMGLSMVYGIVKEMHGSISVYSEKGMGTAFHLLFPLQEKPADTDTAQPKDSLVYGKGTILLVDDEEAIIEWTSRILIELGYNVNQASGGQEALDIFLKTPDEFDLVLTDLRMPGMTGIDLAKKIRAARSDIPVIISTGFSEGLTKETLNKYGISKILMKPMVASELARAVNHCLKQQEIEL